MLYETGGSNIITAEVVSISRQPSYAQRSNYMEKLKEGAKNFNQEMGEGKRNISGLHGLINEKIIKILEILKQHRHSLLSKLLKNVFFSIILSLYP